MMFKTGLGQRLVRWLEDRGILANEQDSRMYDWADQMLDLREEFKERSKRHWREGGPGSREYETWLEDWHARARVLSEMRNRLLSQAHEMTPEERAARSEPDAR